MSRVLIIEDDPAILKGLEDAQRIINGVWRLDVSAAEKLRQDTNHVTFDAFRKKMLELQERQRKLQRVLENEEAYAIDELVDALSRTLTGHGADYRRTPRMTEETKL